MRYEFKREDAERFAKELGIYTKTRGDELHFTRCPYCGNLTNDKDTFAINLRTGQFKCLRASCGAKGTMITLSRDFGFSLGKLVFLHDGGKIGSFRFIQADQPRIRALRPVYG